LVASRTRFCSARIFSSAAALGLRTGADLPQRRDSRACDRRAAAEGRPGLH
jgi:hypothetical protein